MFSLEWLNRSKPVCFFEIWAFVEILNMDGTKNNQLAHLIHKNAYFYSVKQC